MSNFKRAAVLGGPPRKNPLASLKMASMMDTKPVLPAEIIARIVDYLAVPDLVRFARVSRRMQEMVYDDTRWVQRLRRMDCWNEIEARKKTGSVRGGAYNVKSPSGKRRTTNPGSAINGLDRPMSTPKSPDSSQNLTSDNRSRRKSSMKNAPVPADGFDLVSVSSPIKSVPKEGVEDPSLSILKNVRSIRGHARQEYGKVFQALAPYYYDAVVAEHPMSCKVFTTYSSPEHQARMLGQISKFAESDFSPGAYARSQVLIEVNSIFDTAALLEFRKAYEEGDIGSMRKYAHVLHTLNGGQSSIDLFVHHNSLILRKEKLGRPGDCIDYSSGHGQVSLERIQQYLSRLQTSYAEQHAIIESAFPTVDVVIPQYLEQIGQAILLPYLTSLIDEAHERGREVYLRTISATFAQVMNFFHEISQSKSPAFDNEAIIQKILLAIYQSHLDLYLAEELSFFQSTAEAEVETWDHALSEQAASTETFLMSNVNRQADKKDFLSSFKKVVMMPVNILPSFSTSSSSKSTAKSLVNGTSPSIQKRDSRSASPAPGSTVLASNLTRFATPLPLEAPTTEFDAKVALMTSKLENIRSLFSIEVALSLVHHAKASLERAALFHELKGPAGEAAKRQCSLIYKSLIHILGTLHVKSGFDKAVKHLSEYNPRRAGTKIIEDEKSPKSPVQSVPPLTTFLELVNVGDLIQQMLDVFFESELIRLGIAHRDDFLDPSVKEKKKFEQMLDERVAAGLGKGIDVLMDEVEYICATTQKPTDFDPPPPSTEQKGSTTDLLGPSPTAHQIISLISSHTSMLQGTTDKSLLDVFISEIGLRLFTTLTKHLKRQRISTQGSIPLLSDLALYAGYVASFRNADLNSYFVALREVGMIYLIDVPTQVSRGGDREVDELAKIITDSDRYRGVFTVEEVLEFVERRTDWLLIRRRVEGAMYGRGCVVM